MSPQEPRLLALAWLKQLSKNPGQFEEVFQHYRMPPAYVRQAVTLIQQAIDLVNYADSRAELEKLLDAIRSVAPHLAKQQPSEFSNPYKGLLTFRQADKDLFFGREREIAALLEWLETRDTIPPRDGIPQSRFLALVGVSGSGKSSVVFAGLAPRLGEHWRILETRPKNNPFRELAAAWVSLLYADPVDRAANLDKLEKGLHGGGISLAALVQTRDAISPRDGIPKLLLILDQFEELYTNNDQDTQRQYLDCLLAFIRSDAPAALLITLRADFVSAALAWPEFAAALNGHTRFISAMNREELREAIESPVQLAGLTLEAGLSGRILDDVGGEPGRLPLLQFALSELFGQHRDGELTLAGYERIGGVEKALARYAEQRLREFAPEQQAAVHRVLVQLVSPGQGREDTRRVAPQEEFAGQWELIKELADRRLVVTGGQEQNDAQTVELIHEGLIRHWQTLRAWVDADREFRAWQEKTRAEGREWRDKGRDPDALLRSYRLGEAERWLGERAAEIKTAELEYIQASQALRQTEMAEKERRRQELESLLEESRRHERRATEQKQLALQILNERTFDYIQALRKIPGTKPFLIRLAQDNAEALEQIAQLDPDDPAALRNQAANLLTQGDIWLILGDTGKALETYQKAGAIFEKIAASGDANAQRDLSVSFNKFGDLQVQLGNTQAALEAYQKDLDISVRLAKADPNDFNAQRDLSVSLDRLGNLQLKLGNTPEALKHYQQSLDIRVRLAAADPGDSNAQRDLSVSLNKFGDLQLKLGNTQEVLKHYQQSLDIRVRLAAADPNDSNAQRDLSVSYERFGDLQLQLGNTQEALKHYQQSLDINVRLAAADPNDSNAQRDLMVNLYKMSMCWAKQGDEDKAQAELQKATEIAKQRAELDPQDTQAQEEWKVLRGMLE